MTIDAENTCASNGNMGQPAFHMYPVPSNWITTSHTCSIIDVVCFVYTPKDTFRAGFDLL